MAIFLSKFENSIDSKNRVVVPKEFRMNLHQFNGFVGFRSHKLNAIDCFSMEKMESLSAKIDSELDPFSLDRDSLESAIFADAVVLRFDKDGRVSLPDLLLNHANIDKKVMFVGRGATFQIWCPSSFDKHQDSMRKLLMDKK